MTEEEIIKGCCRGDARCEREIFRQYSGKLFTICRRYSSNSMQAEDWLQDAFIRIFQTIHQYKFRGSLEGWLHRVTISIILKTFQKKHFKNERPASGQMPDQAVPAQVMAHLHEEELLRLIRQLPDGYRIIFNMHAIEGYSHREIATLLEIQESTSRSQLAKARKLLQSQVAQLHSVKI